MARPLRIEFSGALYHLTARGNAKQDIFIHDDDRSDFLKLVENVCNRHHWYCHAYCLMSNHYHLQKNRVKPHAVIGDQSSGLKSRPGNYSFTPVVLRSSLQVIGYCKFREGKATGRNASESVLASLTYWGC